jgi:hypothetical protein
MVFSEIIDDAATRALLMYLQVQGCITPTEIYVPDNDYNVYISVMRHTFVM